MKAATVTAIAVLAMLPIENAGAQRAERPLKVIYPFAAGNSGDNLARLVADRLGNRLGVAAIVENRAGASGRIGIKAVIAAEPDGSTLLVGPMGPMALHPIAYSDLDFDPLKDLAPVAHLATFDLALVVGGGVPAKSAAELVAWIKANPDKANYGTPGLGGLPHFFAVMFQTSAGVSLRNVPYRGSAAVMNDLVSGQLPIAFVPTSENVELHESGRTRILATSGPQRSPFLQQVPTFKEAGYAIEGEGWFGLFAPARTPQATLQRLGEAMQAVMRDEAVRARILGFGLVPTGSSAAELGRQQLADQERWAPAIRASGFKPSD
jgi:tripartite-type tricarboxylate transporter receptor subunit TctC